MKIQFPMNRQIGITKLTILYPLVVWLTEGSDGDGLCHSGVSQVPGVLGLGSANGLNWSKWFNSDICDLSHDKSAFCFRFYVIFVGIFFDFIKIFAHACHALLRRWRHLRDCYDTVWRFSNALAKFVGCDVERNIFLQHFAMKNSLKEIDKDCVILHRRSESEEANEDGQEDESSHNQRNEGDFGKFGHAVEEGQRQR